MPAKADFSADELRIHGWLSAGVNTDASDLHVVPGRPPMLRVHGDLQEMAEIPLDAGELEAMLRPLCPPEAVARLDEERHIDFSLTLELDVRPRRFRVNYFYSGKQLGACFRFIPEDIPELTWANFPPAVADRLSNFRNGLVLFTGVAGSGKSTSLAMIVNVVNRRGGARILTIEEPIEYLFPAAGDSLVTQREVGVDVRNFAEGLVSGLRQDPDVIFVGEIRDRETARMALSAAETGHLVFSTLHSRDAKGAVSRFVDLFPQTVQGEVRSQLSFSLRSIVSQHLLPSAIEGQKRELALEILFNNSPIASSIRQGKLESIDNNILTGAGDGMRTLEESVKRLFEAGRITQETAARYVTSMPMYPY